MDMNKSSVDQISTHPAVIATTSAVRFVPINFTADEQRASPNEGAGASLGAFSGSYDEHGGCGDDPCDCGVRG